MKEGFDYMPVPEESGEGEHKEQGEIQPVGNDRAMEGASVFELKTLEASENPIIEIAQVLAGSIIEMSRSDKNIVLTRESVARFINDNLKAKVNVGRADEIKDPFEETGSSELDPKDLEMLLTRTVQELELKNIPVTG